MVKIGVNGFGHIRCLVTKAVFITIMVDTVTINDSFTGFNFIVYMFQYDFTYLRFNDTEKAENRKLVIKGKPISIFQE
ncbi:hypothetical protein EGM_14687 [Macaca fascicularis]|uniref:glyceraldehyde-3-phosphate dehydrogenase (phosphorylating) n=1 Tax=Macaca fascicularis TaxID=9541 RepID=G7P697_MACFA|nr:hypothetical protein EGM_14687 [Macaca fascicularis]